MILFTLLQVTDPVVNFESANKVDIITLMMKGGWIMIPLLLLSVLAVFIISDCGFAIKKLRAVDQRWFTRMMGLVTQGDYDEAYKIARRSGSALAKVMRKGIESCDLPQKQVEEDMQVETRQTLSRVEAQVGYLSLIASVAPMLGFLGTIFGVIKIFIHISMTNDLSISSISDGLYQKMICSGVGLLIGIFSYCGYYILNRQIDKMILVIDSGANQLLKGMFYNRGK